MSACRIKCSICWYLGVHVEYEDMSTEVEKAFVPGAGLDDSYFLSKYKYANILGIILPYLASAQQHMK